jgi:hypothetical protein
MAQASESASAMEVDDAAPAFGGRNDKLQLPWVEKYRPKRYVLFLLFLIISLISSVFICG